jgi:hypothetical protein
MEPPQDAERIVFDVSSRIEIGRDQLREQISDRFEPGAGRDDLIDAGQIAKDVLDDAWGELSSNCDRALADVHELYLVQAARVLEAQRDLHELGSESWIARAVLHQQSFQLAWDVLDEKGLLMELD